MEEVCNLDILQVMLLIDMHIWTELAVSRYPHDTRFYV
jgi:hypothetical protein